MLGIITAVPLYNEVSEQRKQILVLLRKQPLSKEIQEPCSIERAYSGSNQDTNSAK